MNLNSSNSETAGYGLDIWGMSMVQFPTEEKLFSLPIHPDWFWNPLILTFSGYGGVGCSFPGAEQLVHEAYYSLLTSHITSKLAMLLLKLLFPTQVGCS
jgi:hypothetical protein